jgi:hypothetical protein
VNFRGIPPSEANIIALGSNVMHSGVSAHVDTSKLASTLAKAIFTDISPNPLPETYEVYLKYGAFTVV